MSLRSDTPVQFLKGVGPRRAEAFQRLGIATVEDLLYHVPHRYLDATTVTPIARARIGDEVTLVGDVVSTGVVPTSRRRLKIFRAVIRDDSGVIECAWPGQPFLDRVIRAGQRLLVSGPVKFYHGRQVSPREQIVLADPGRGSGSEGSDLASGVVVPVYRATEGLSHRQIRSLLHQNLDSMLDTVVETLPPAVIGDLGLVGLRVALEAVHRPDSMDQAEAGRRRLAFDELLDIQIVVTRARHVARSSPKGATFELKRKLTTGLKNHLPFELTHDQKKAVREVSADMVSDRRMHRLLMGDVGTGKTIVALFAMLLAAENGYQSAFMAPTELLAEQHGRTLSRLLAPLGLTPELLLGRFTGAEKGAVRARLATGDSPLVIGTHALIQEQTEIANLGLVVIDEQHRFGVEQRAALVEKGSSPDVLLLSATPIPRSLALTLYGDLDISTLRERPADRVPVRTALRPTRERRRIYEFIRRECEEGRQAYVVYPVIDESERTDLRAATTMTDEIRRNLDPVEVGLVHGRMKAEERDAVMRRFRDGEIGVLVATTVIEVGIDVANATTMVIEHPERFGLAQLHQLRGRVGRGADQSHCILLVPEGVDPRRLKQFCRTNDGFRIAELDLKERGMGELVGARQSGGIQLRFTDLSTDTDLVASARSVADRILRVDPQLEKNQGLRSRIERRYERGIELFRVG